MKVIKTLKVERLREIEHSEFAAEKEEGVGRGKCEVLFVIRLSMECK